MESKRMRIHEWDRDLAEALPCAEMYEKSYMHRDTVTHVAVATRTNFFVTASSDGHLKLWKKVFGDVEFVKHFRAHLTRINDLCVSFDGTLCATVAEDKTLKVYDIVGYDLMVFIPLQFSPQCSEWIYRPTDAHTNIAIADRGSGQIFIYDVRGDGIDPLHTLKLHRSRVRCMKFVEKLNLVISGDENGMIEYWSTSTFKFPEKSVNFDLKLQTDLFVLAKQRLPVEKLAVSPDGKSFAVISNDRKIRIFRLKFGKLKRTYDETLEMANQVQKSDDLAQKLEDIDFGRRLMIEKQMDKEAIVSTNVEFDESGEFLLYATHLGIKIVHIKSNKVVKVLGKIENTERFLRVALYQGSPDAASGTRINKDQSEGIQRDPVVLCCAYKKQRLYMFTRREPDDAGDESLGRDVFNERPSAEEMIAATPTEYGNKAKEVVLHTTSGDIAVSLYGKECPKTVENFTGHCRNGYYDNVLFHRVIKGFMIQTGDPLGDGTGGTSIWGNEFEDEFHGSLRHNRPYIVSMANSGPNTNGSQFFITTAATPWLDNKHTVFGIVTRGTEVVNQIECVETDDNDKPLDDIKILNVSVLA